MQLAAHSGDAIHLILALPGTIQPPAVGPAAASDNSWLMVLVQDDLVLQAFAADAANEPFYVEILPSALWSDENLLRSRCAARAAKSMPRRYDHGRAGDTAVPCPTGRLRSPAGRSTPRWGVPCYWNGRNVIAKGQDKQDEQHFWVPSAHKIRTMRSCTWFFKGLPRWRWRSLDRMREHCSGWTAPEHRATRPQTRQPRPEQTIHRTEVGQGTERW